MFFNKQLESGADLHFQQQKDGWTYSFVLLLCFLSIILRCTRSFLLYRLLDVFVPGSDAGVGVVELVHMRTCMV